MGNRPRQKNQSYRRPEERLKGHNQIQDERIQCRGQRRRHAKGGADRQKQYESEDRREESQIGHREQLSSLRALQIRRTGRVASSGSVWALSFLFPVHLLTFRKRLT